jgi:hypothetical protein
MLTPGISPMAFALNNPVSLVDPTGLASEEGEYEPPSFEEIDKKISDRIAQAMGNAPGTGYHFGYGSVNSANSSAQKNPYVPKVYLFYDDEDQKMKDFFANHQISDPESYMQELASNIEHIFSLNGIKLKLISTTQRKAKRMAVCAADAFLEFRGGISGTGATMSPAGAPKLNGYHTRYRLGDSFAYWHKNGTYATSMVLAHELLHQFVYQAYTFFYREPYSVVHDNSQNNLLMSGTITHAHLYNKKSSKIRPLEQITKEHKLHILQYLIFINQ